MCLSCSVTLLWRMLQIILIQYNCVNNRIRLVLWYEGEFNRKWYVSVLGGTIWCLSEKTYSCYVFVCTFIPCVRTHSKCHVFPSGHMLIDYQTGFKWCDVNLQATTHTSAQTVFWGKIFRKNETDGSEFSCVE